MLILTVTYIHNKQSSLLVFVSQSPTSLPLRYTIKATIFLLLQTERK